jgi:hypothetical protein
MIHDSEKAPALLMQLVSMLKADIAALSTGDWKNLMQTVDVKTRLYAKLSHMDIADNADALRITAQEGLALAAEAQLRLNLAVDAVRNRLQVLNEALGHQIPLAYKPAVIGGKSRHL